MEVAYTKQQLEKTRKLVYGHREGVLHCILTYWEIGDDFMEIGISDPEGYDEEYLWREEIGDKVEFPFSVKSPDVGRFPIKDEDKLSEKEDIYLPYTRAEVGLRYRGYLEVYVILINGVRLKVSPDAFRIMLDIDKNDI